RRGHLFVCHFWPPLLLNAHVVAHERSRPGLGRRCATRRSRISQITFHMREKTRTDVPWCSRTETTFAQARSTKNFSSLTFRMMNWSVLPPSIIGGVASLVTLIGNCDCPV